MSNQEEHNAQVRRNAERHAELDRQYGHLSDDEIEAEIERLERKAAGHFQHADELAQFKAVHPKPEDPNSQ